MRQVRAAHLLTVEPASPHHVLRERRDRVPDHGEQHVVAAPAQLVHRGDGEVSSLSSPIAGDEEQPQRSIRMLRATDFSGTRFHPGTKMGDSHERGANPEVIDQSLTAPGGSDHECLGALGDLVFDAQGSSAHKGRHPGEVRIGIRQRREGRVRDLHDPA